MPPLSSFSYFSLFGIVLSTIAGCASIDPESIKPEPPNEVLQNIVQNAVWLEKCAADSNIKEDSEVYNRAAAVILSPLLNYRTDKSVLDAIDARVAKALHFSWSALDGSLCKAQFWPSIENRYLQLEREAIAREKEELENQRRAQNLSLGLNVLFGALDAYSQGQRNLANSYQNSYQQMLRPQPYQFPQLTPTPTLKTTCNNFGFSTSCETSVDKPVWMR